MRSSQIYVGLGLLIALVVVALVLCGLAFAGLNAHPGTRNLKVVPRAGGSVSSLFDEPRLTLGGSRSLRVPISRSSPSLRAAP
jgi:hypothetical protein